MRTASGCFALGSTVSLGCFGVGQAVALKVTSQGLVVVVPDDGVDSTDVVAVGDVERVGFGHQPFLHPTGSTVERSPGVVSAARGCQALGAALRRDCLGVRHVLVLEVALQSPVVSVPVHSTTATLDYKVFKFFIRLNLFLRRAN